MNRTLIVLLIVAPCLIGSLLAQNDNERVIGLVELPGLLGTRDPNGPPGLIPPEKVQPVRLHSHPSSKSPVIANVSNSELLETAEFAYEALAATVYEVTDGWLRLRLTDASKNIYGWVSPNSRGSFHPIADLLTSGLCYLTNDWDGALFVDSAASKVIRQFEENEDTVNINVLRTKEQKDGLWLEVEILGPGRCEGNDPKSIAKGWVPAYGKNGRGNAWFFSRGC